MLDNAVGEQGEGIIEVVGQFLIALTLAGMS